MRWKSFVSVGAVALTSMSLALSPRAADACAMVVPGEGSPAALAGEATLVAYDADAHVEHFVRSVRFTSSVQRFGFLVPVPSKPTIAEAQEAIFAKLEELAKPPEAQLVKAAPVAAAALASAPEGVTVIEQAKVKGLDYAVLQALGGKELTAWLDQNKFVSYPELTTWAEDYALKQAFFVAFKYELPKAGQTAEALPGAVRISFATPRAYYPYREPKPQGAGARSLRLFVLGEGPVSAVVAGATWSTYPTWHGSIPVQEATNLETFLPGVRMSARSTYLTAFTDTTTQRPASDLFFDFEWKHKILSVRLALLLVVGGALFGGIALYLRRRRKRILGIP